MENTPGTEEESRKTYVLDTNVLIHNPSALWSFKENDVVIPLCVIEELDRLKDSKSEDSYVRYAARSAIRKLRGLMKRGSLRNGVPLNKSGGRLFVSSIDKLDALPPELDRKKVDNEIVAVALKHKDKSAILVTNDTNMAIKAQFCGIAVEEYKSDKLLENAADLYSGFIELKVLFAGVLTAFGEAKKMSAGDAVSDDRKKLFDNQCCKLVSGDHYLLAIYKKESDKFVLVPKESDTKSRVKPRNDEQKLSLALLSDPSIELVTIVGSAGTGKTLISLLAGYLQQEHIYERIIVFRPHIEAGGGMGFLPGELQEKFAPWTLPIIDNYGRILGDYDDDTYRKDGDDDKQSFAGKKKRVGGKEKSSYQRVGRPTLVEEEIRHGLLEISPMDYLRGRTLDHAFVIVDEAQNMTLHQLKTIITRAGEGTKVVLIGDVTQIDNPYLTAETNGLTHVVEKFKGNSIFGHITMVKGDERSRLVGIAAEIL